MSQGWPRGIRASLVGVVFGVKEVHSPEYPPPPAIKCPESNKSHPWILTSHSLCCVGEWVCAVCICTWVEQVNLGLKRGRWSQLSFCTCVTTYPWKHTQLIWRVVNSGISLKWALFSRKAALHLFDCMILTFHSIWTVCLRGILSQEASTMRDRLSCMQSSNQLNSLHFYVLVMISLCKGYVWLTFTCKLDAAVELVFRLFKCVSTTVVMKKWCTS